METVQIYQSWDRETEKQLPSPARQTVEQPSPVVRNKDRLTHTKHKHKLTQNTSSHTHLIHTRTPVLVRIDAGDRKKVQGEHIINNGRETGQEQRLDRGQNNDINADTGNKWGSRQL
jgi:hypothetical protein